MKFTLTKQEASETSLRILRIQQDLIDNLSRIRANGNFTIGHDGVRKRVPQAAQMQMQVNIDALWIAAHALEGDVTVVDFSPPRSQGTGPSSETLTADKPRD